MEVAGKPGRQAIIVSSGLRIIQFDISGQMEAGALRTHGTSDGMNEDISRNVGPSGLRVTRDLHNIFTHHSFLS
jgi:hypothetical protein